MYITKDFTCYNCGAITEAEFVRYGVEEEEINCEWCGVEVGNVMGHSMEFAKTKLITQGKPEKKHK